MNVYEVEITGTGRSGDVIYKESGENLTFWWEFSTNGAIISVPSDEKWNLHCQSAGAKWANDRKAEIVQRIAVEVVRQKASTAKIEVENEWINLIF